MELLVSNGKSQFWIRFKKNLIKVLPGFIPLVAWKYWSKIKFCEWTLDRIFWNCSGSIRTRDKNPSISIFLNIGWMAVFVSLVWTKVWQKWASTISQHIGSVRDVQALARHQSCKWHRSTLRSAKTPWSEWFSNSHFRSEMTSSWNLEITHLRWFGSRAGNVFATADTKSLRWLRNTLLIFH